MLSEYESVEPVPFGNYQLVERLAVGGMAEVYLAHPTQAPPERLVALKRILPNIAADDEFVAMFVDEAKIAGQLNHPNVASILDLGRIDESYFIAMEYVSGHDMRALWDRTRLANGGSALPLGMACHAVRKLCDGLDYAHRKRDAKGRPLGIIHRDVSPQNVLVSYTGDVKIIDFGIAKAANRMVRTQTGILKGKFAYMAPEQARGEAIDHRADIFAIGVILYELLTGERAFKAETDFALLERVRKVEVVPMRQIRADIPRELERVVMRALARDPSARYPWASTLATELERVETEFRLSTSREELAQFLVAKFQSEFNEEQLRLRGYRNRLARGSAGATSPPHRVATTAAANAQSMLGPINALDRAANVEVAWGQPTEAHSVKPAAAKARDDSEVDASDVALARRAQDETQLETMADVAPVVAPRVVVARDEKVKPARPPPSGSFGNSSGSFPHSTATTFASNAHAGSSTSQPSIAASPRANERSAARLASKPAGLRSFRFALATTAAFSFVAGASLSAWYGATRQPAAADAVIVTTPRQARIAVLGQEVCDTTPCAIRLGAGKHVIEARLADGPTTTHPVEVGDSGVTRVELLLAQPRDNLRLETDPPGAQVFLDDQLLPTTTPLTLPAIEVGKSVRLRMMHDGFQVLDVIRTVDDAAVWRHPLPTNFTTYALQVTPVDANIEVSGGTLKERDNKRTILVGAAKPAEVRIERPGCTAYATKLRASGKNEGALAVDLDCKPMARSGVMLTPPKRGAIRIDGIEVARNADLNKYALPVGTWTIQLRVKNRAETFTVDVRDGEYLPVP